MSDHFTTMTKREGWPVGNPVEYDLSQYDHQIPGGVMATLRYQLSQIGSEHLFEKVVEETSRVRRELGYPIMVTPASQFIVAQATMNVLSGERYGAVCDEVIMKVLGHSGRVPGEIAPNVLDRIMSLPRAKELSKWEPPQTSIEEIQQKIGPKLSDDELLLRLYNSEEAIKEMRASGPVKTKYPEMGKPMLAVMKELMEQKKAKYIYLQKGGFSCILKKGSEAK
jgi:oxaloacetate decarboxylase alpha subunit